MLIFLWTQNSHCLINNLVSYIMCKFCIKLRKTGTLSDPFEQKKPSDIQLSFTPFLSFLSSYFLFLLILCAYFLNFTFFLGLLLGSAFYFTFYPYVLNSSCLSTVFSSSLSTSAPSTPLLLTYPSPSSSYSSLLLSLLLNLLHILHLHP
jgi:hypothetical protein